MAIENYVVLYFEVNGKCRCHYCLCH